MPFIVIGKLWSDGGAIAGTDIDAKPCFCARRGGNQFNPLMLSNQGGTIVLYDQGNNSAARKRIHRVHYTNEQARVQGVPIRFLSM